MMSICKIYDIMELFSGCCLHLLASIASHVIVQLGFYICANLAFKKVGKNKSDFPAEFHMV